MCVCSILLTFAYSALAITGVGLIRLHSKVIELLDRYNEQYVFVGWLSAMSSQKPAVHQLELLFILSHQQI